MTDVPVDYDPFAKTTKFDARGNAVPEPADKTYPVDYNPFEQTGLSQFREAHGLPPVTTPPPSKPTNVVDAVAQGMARQAGNALIGPREAYRHGMTPEQEVEWASGTALQMAGRAPFAPEGAAGIFGGRFSSTADLWNLKLAEKMHERGFDRKQIWDATGWFQGADGKWRYEIPDTKYHLKNEKDKIGMPKAVQENSMGVMGKQSTIQHPDLGEAYPSMQGLETSFSATNVGPQGAYYAKDAIYPEALEVNSPNYFTQLDTAIHELMHAVQRREGFAGGGSSAKMLSLPETKQIAEEFGVDPEYLAKEAYRRLMGEVEARNVQKRMLLAPHERKAIPPWETEDVPRSQQIVPPGYDISNLELPGATVEGASIAEATKKTPANVNKSRKELREELRQGKRTYESNLPPTDAVLPLPFLKAAVDKKLPSVTKIPVNIPPPLDIKARLWQNYGSYLKNLSPDEALRSEPIWGTAIRLSQEKGISEYEAFSELANEFFSRNGLNRYMSPEMAKKFMARERAGIRIVK